MRDYSNKFIKLVTNEYGLSKWSNKLSKWWELDFADFIKVLQLKLSLSQKDELLGLFEKYQSSCLDFDIQIKKTESEINQLVYKLVKLPLFRTPILDS